MTHIEHPPSRGESKADTEMVTVDIETLLRRLPIEAVPLSAQKAVDDLMAKKTPPLTVHQRRRFIEAAKRPLRVRRAILALAGAATGHKPNARNYCRECHAHWPCQEVLVAAGEALDAVADLRA